MFITKVDSGSHTHTKGVNEIHIAMVQRIKATFLTRLLKIWIHCLMLGTMATRVACKTFGTNIPAATAAHHPPQTTVSQMDHQSWRIQR